MPSWTRRLAYVIFEGEVTAAGGRYLISGGDVEVLDGQPPAARTVVLELPSRRAALDWWQGDACTQVREISERAARTHRLFLVDGWSG